MAETLHSCSLGAEEDVHERG